MNLESILNFYFHNYNFFHLNMDRQYLTFAEPENTLPTLFFFKS